MSIKVILTDPTLAELQAVLGAAGIGAGGTGSSGAPGGTNFPADPTQAPFPSPDGSAVIWFNGAASGAPYVRDRTGNIYEIRPIGTPPIPTVFFNGTSQDTPDNIWSYHANGPPAKIQIWGGGAYTLLTSNVWQAGPPWYNATPPIPGSSGGTGAGTGTGPVVVPPVPPILPGSTGKIILAGASQTIKTLGDAIAAAVDGDTIQMDPGAYKETPSIILKIIKLDLGGSTWDATGLTGTLAYGKGLFVSDVPFWIDNGTITGVAMDQTTGQNTSAIRRNDNCPWMKVTRIVAHGNQCAIGWGGGVPGVLDVEDCDISGNGIAGVSPLTHNSYIDTSCAQLTWKNVVSTDPVAAHAVKYRGAKFICNTSTLSSMQGSCANFPTGCDATFTDCHLIKPAGSPDHKIIDNDEAQTNGLLPININGGNLDALCDSPFFQIPTGVTITATGVTKTGNPVTVQGGGAIVGF